MRSVWLPRKLKSLTYSHIMSFNIDPEEMQRWQYQTIMTLLKIESKAGYLHVSFVIEVILYESSFRL